MIASIPSTDGATPARALIGFGHVWHRRLRPVVHEFRHRSYFLMLPLRSLRRRPEPTLRRNRFGWLAFHDRDHGDGGDDALAWFDDLLAREGVHDADGEVWLQTYPRVLGHTFKPVSFWYAHRADGSLAAVLAEVNNTFGDRHAYLLAPPALDGAEEVCADKVLHVSPFCRVEGRYRFRFDWRCRPAAAGISSRSPGPAGPAPEAGRALSEPAGAHAIVRIDHDDGDGPLLQTSLSGTLQALTPESVRRACFGLPLLTLFIVLRIHWHALRLALKRVAFHRRPAAPHSFVTR